MVINLNFMLKNIFCIVFFPVFLLFNGKTFLFPHWSNRALFYFTKTFYLPVKKIFFFFSSLQKQCHHKSNITNKILLCSNLYHHFFEFRLRLSYIVFSLLTAFLTCYYYCFEIIYIFTKPFLCYAKYFIFTDLTEAFYTSVEISFFFSFYAVIPLFLYQFWCFFIPSKFKSERKNISLIIFSIFIFLILSTLFVYFFLLPKLYIFLLDFQINTNLLNLQLEAKIKSYVQLVCKIFILASLFFQLPLIFLLFIKLQWIKMNVLTTNRTKIFFFVLIILSLLSPPDIFTQLSASFFFMFFLEILFILGFFYEKLLIFEKIFNDSS
jgi:sec-independent protein translocase protein TatC